MKVRDLIAALQALPQDALVVIDGYEGGATVPMAPEIVQIHHRDTNGEDWYWGEYEYTLPNEPEISFAAVALQRRRG